ncbi:MAG TPA: methyltransferase domain-containing protein [Solirubrobacteraceae bacterium]|nr:methyltransferase domain-containing protein [Solirubrobacteraceae bacterium]
MALGQRLRARRRGPERPPLAGLEPISRTFGFDRGRPIDRFYIENFLAEHAADVRGHVLEVAEPTYTRRFGTAVTRSDVLHAAPGNPEATIVGDLVSGDGIPAAAFDCVVLTQTLSVIYDARGAVEGVRRALKPGGVLLVTVPGISQISREDRREWGEYWRFTTDSLRTILADAFGSANVDVESHGNVFVAAAFLYGLATEDLSDVELQTRDEDFDFLICGRAVASD